jgi:hypothetical protein
MMVALRENNFNQMSLLILNLKHIYYNIDDEMILKRYYLVKK